MREPPTVAVVAVRDHALGVEWIAPSKNAAVGKNAEFQLIVRNTGRKTLHKLSVTSVWEGDTFEPTAATDGFEMRDNRLAWKVDQLSPGQESQYTIRLLCKKESPSATIVAKIICAEGVAETASARLRVGNFGARATNVAPLAASRDTSANLGPSASRVDSARGKAAARAALRYDGKSFAEWCQLLETELSPQRRAEAITAIEVFGVHGYGAEAADEIFKAMASPDLEPLFARESNQNDELIKVVEAATKAIGHLPRADTIPILLELLDSDRVNMRIFAAAVSTAANLQAKELFPKLVKLARDENSLCRSVALEAAMHIDPQNPEVIAAWNAALHDKEESVVGHALNFGLCPDGSPLPSDIVDALLGLAIDPANSVAIRERAMVALGRSRPAEDRVIMALEELTKSDNKRIAKDAQEVLGGMRPMMIVDLDPYAAAPGTAGEAPRAAPNSQGEAPKAIPPQAAPQAPSAAEAPPTVRPPDTAVPLLPVLPQAEPATAPQASPQ